MSRIRARREALRVEFSQHHLAKLTGIPQTKISLIERDLVDPTAEEREKIARALQCDVVALWPEQEEVCPR
jgi:transcriptional regulator with XRE-family HTH domain